MNRWISAVGISWLLVSACGGSVTHSDDTDSGDDETSTSNGSGNGSGNNNSGNNSGSGGNNSSANNGSANNSSANDNSSNGSGGDDTSSSGSGQASVVTVVGAVGTGGTIGVAGGSFGGSGGSSGGEFGGTGGWADGGATFGSSASVTGSGGNLWGDIPIPPECEGWVNNNDSRSCEMELECPDEWAWSYCNNDGPSFSCQCESDRNYGEYEISGVDINAACPWAAAACVRAPELTWSPSDCEPTFQEQGTTYCSAQAECTSSAMEGVVTISKREWISSYCDQIGSAWQCSCDRPDRYTNLEFAELPEGATCLDVLDWCNGDDIEPLGQVSCVPTYQSAGTDYCDAELECRYAVLVAGVEATLEERVPLNCARNADGTFSCQCSGTTSQSFPVMAGDAWSACGEASSICAQTP